MTSRESLATALLTAMCSAPGHLALTEKETVARAIAMADLMLFELNHRPTPLPFRQQPLRSSYADPSF